MNPLVAVLFLAVAALATDHPLPAHMNNIVDKEGEQYKLYKTYTESITLSSDNQRDAFVGLNVHGKEDTVDKEDLDIFFWHDNLHYAVKKFLKFVDDNSDDKIHLQELQDEFKEKPVRVALIECHYLKSKGLRQSCFADQLLTYASLCLDDNDVKSLEAHIGGTNGISKAEAESIDHPKNKDKKVTAEELGAYYGNEGVSLDEFKDFVTQETISDDFRRCRKGKPDVTTGNVEFKNDCLLEEIVEYTNQDLTDLDVAVLFHAFDIDGKGGITKEELGHLPGVKDTPDAAKKVDKIMKLMDMSLTTPTGTQPVIDFGEFRAFLRQPTVLVQAEKECTEVLHVQKDELVCLFNLAVKLALHEHDAIWMVVPDLEQQIAFESLDTSDDGEIKASELNFADDKTEDRFDQEMDHDKSGYVCLEEWNEYMDIPHMVYGTGDCLLKPRNKDGRAHCFPHQIEDVLDNIKHFDNDHWVKWFQFYDSNVDNIISVHDNNEAVQKFGSQDLENLFLSELGQGDSMVTLFEFKWYVKQQELADSYEAVVTAGKKDVIEEHHKILMKFIQDDMTEYDTQELFNELDVDDNHELEQKDFGADLWPKIKEMLVKIDGVEPHGDADVTVNFREFWLWLNQPTKTGNGKVFVKDTFENECTKKIYGKDQQKEEIACYVKYFKENAEALSQLC